MTVKIHPYVRKILDGTQSLPPIGAMLGARILSFDIEAGTLEIEYQGAPEFMNPASQIQGGMLAAMLDDVTAMLTLSSLEAHQHCATLNLNIAYLRPVLLGPVTARSVLAKSGSRICNANGELWQNGKLTTTATAVIMVMS